MQTDEQQGVALNDERAVACGLFAPDAAVYRAAANEDHLSSQEE
jgi:hypothetical protein